MWVNETWGNQLKRRSCQLLVFVFILFSGFQACYHCAKKAAHVTALLDITLSLFLFHFQEYKFDRYIENGKKKTTFYKAGRKLKYFLMPFGSGISMCPGRFLAMNEMKMFLFILLSHFDVELAENKSVRLDNSRMGLGILLPDVDIAFRYKLRSLRNWAAAYMPSTNLHVCSVSSLSFIFLETFAFPSLVLPPSSLFLRRKAIGLEVETRCRDMQPQFVLPELWEVRWHDKSLAK